MSANTEKLVIPDDMIFKWELIFAVIDLVEYKAVYVI